MRTAAKGSRTPQALSKRTRRHLLSSLRQRAIAGDVAAAEVLIRLGQQTAAVEPTRSVPAVRASRP
jgi:hypothetical protein